MEMCNVNFYYYLTKTLWCYVTSIIFAGTVSMLRQLIFSHSGALNIFYSSVYGRTKASSIDTNVQKGIQAICINFLFVWTQNTCKETIFKVPKWLKMNCS